MNTEVEEKLGHTPQLAPFSRGSEHPLNLILNRNSTLGIGGCNLISKARGTLLIIGTCLLVGVFYLKLCVS